MNLTATILFVACALVAVGADLEPGTLLAAYRGGLFPMPLGRRRLGWWSPDPRGVLPLERAWDLVSASPAAACRCPWRRIRARWSLSCGS